MPILFFLIILVIVAGLVAAVGDRMGHRAARAKIRIGNLRPRTVSTIIAVVTGILISLATYGLVFLIWADFREALTRYRTVKDELTSVQGEIEKSQDELEQTRAELEQARAEKQQADSELAMMREEKIELVQDVSQMEQELIRSRTQLSGVKGEVERLRHERKALQDEIEISTIRIESLRELKEQMAERYGEGEIILSRGTYLSYVPVNAGEASLLPGRLQVAVDRLAGLLAQDGLRLAENSNAVAKQYVEANPGIGVDDDYVITISVARNVFENEEVQLAFEAQRLEPLISKGDVLMEVVVSETTARIRMIGIESRDISVPPVFDTDALVDFSVQLQDRFIAGARASGFLPSAQTGEFATPIESLADIATDLMERERPFVLQFVAREEATALDSLAAVDIYVSNPAATETGDESGNVDVEAIPNNTENGVAGDAS